MEVIAGGRPTSRCLRRSWSENHLRRNGEFPAGQRWKWEKPRVVESRGENCQGKLRELRRSCSWSCGAQTDHVAGKWFFGVVFGWGGYNYAWKFMLVESFVFSFSFFNLYRLRESCHLSGKFLPIGLWHECYFSLLDSGDCWVFKRDIRTCLNLYINSNMVSEQSRFESYRTDD